MGKIISDETLTFGDVLLKPSYSEIKSRSSVDLSVSITKNFKFMNPLIPANMKSIISKEMAIEIVKLKNLGFMHRFCSFEEQLNIIKELQSINFGFNPMNYFGVSVGVKEEDRDNVEKFYNSGVRIFCIDVAHGHSRECGDMTKFIKSKCLDSLVVSGNVATTEGAKYLWDCGADVVKCGVGSGAICTTRLKAGAGVPQLSAVKDIYDFKVKNPEYMNKKFISDGGIRVIGDCVKALAFADMVMMGNAFSGCEETPEEIMEIDGQKYKKYAGSSTYKTTHIEGVVSLVSVKGKFKDIVEEYSQGIKSGCSYTGASNLAELKYYASFVRITNSSKEESGAHDVKVIK